MIKGTCVKVNNKILKHYPGWNIIGYYGIVQNEAEILIEVRLYDPIKYKKVYDMNNFIWFSCLTKLTLKEAEDFLDKLMVEELNFQQY